MSRGAVGEWLPLVERAFAVAVSREHAQALATLALAAVRGLQLDLLAPANDHALRQHSRRC